MNRNDAAPHRGAHESRDDRPERAIGPTERGPGADDGEQADHHRADEQLLRIATTPITNA